MNIEIQKETLLSTDIQEMMIPASRVACVYLGNTLEHALLVLIKSGYSAIPVLDMESKVQGTISKTLILDSILGLERILFEALGERTVETVMNRNYPRVNAAETFQRALELSINHPFLCIEGEQGEFAGILTRRAILALLYRHFRQS